MVPRGHLRYTAARPLLASILSRSFPHIQNSPPSLIPKRATDRPPLRLSHPLRSIAQANPRYRPSHTPSTRRQVAVWPQRHPPMVQMCHRLVLRQVAAKVARKTHLRPSSLDSPSLNITRSRIVTLPLPQQFILVQRNCLRQSHDLGHFSRKTRQIYGLLLVANLRPDHTPPSGGIKIIFISGKVCNCKEQCRPNCPTEGLSINHGLQCSRKPTSGSYHPNEGNRLQEHQYPQAQANSSNPRDLRLRGCQWRCGGQLLSHLPQCHNCPSR